MTDHAAAGRLRAAIRKEFRQIVRDPLLLTLVLWLYSVEIVMCALALSFDLKEEPVAVVDLDRSAASLTLAERFDRVPEFAVRHRPATAAAARALLERGEARLVVVVPRGYERELARTGTAPPHAAETRCVEAFRALPGIEAAPSHPMRSKPCRNL